MHGLLSLGHPLLQEIAKCPMKGGRPDLPTHVADQVIRVMNDNQASSGIFDTGLDSELEDGP